ncbi:hypothetical protein [Marinoscillum pacificum]|uniref:hypothetical protein n=1 Tax=Marinoscillum pacificum TaxID=392723 RepID=UPI0021582E9F|nr:hypothetical protein [Marinoscillum pacificum]
MKIIKLGLLGLTLCLSGVLAAQSINSPYSNHQLGEFLFQGLPHNFSMGQVGTGTPTPWHINLQNPALLTYNKFSSFQVGLQADFRTYTADLDNSKAQSGSLRALAVSFPVVNDRWTTAFAVLPLTTMNYNTQSRAYIDLQDSILKTIDYKGEGGLTQVQWANGVRLFDRLTIGAKASYVFGTLHKESSVFVSSTETVSNYAVSYNEDARYSDIILNLGVSYQYRIDTKNIITVGAVHGLSKKITGTQKTIVDRISASRTVLDKDTIAIGVPIEFDLPQYFEFGVSYELLNKFRAGFDFSYHNWEDTESNEVSATRNTVSIGTGIEFIPDYSSINSYLKRTSYRMGLSMRQLPYLENNTEINDFGINFGVSFPVSGYSSLDAAFKYGFRGTTDNNLIQERYFQVVIGATINDRWFIKRRYD